MHRTTTALQRTGLAVLLALAPASVAARLPQRLERGNGPEPGTLDPHRHQEVACGNVRRDLFEGPVTADAAGRLTLAQRCPVSADGRRWTFVLRDRLRWSNREPLDAAQVVAGFQRAFVPATHATATETDDAHLDLA